MPSPTINTKAAMQDVFEMFNQPLAEQQDWEYEDETISAKVYRPEQVKIGVFKDSDDEDDAQEQPRVTPPSSVSGSRHNEDEYEINIEDHEHFPFPAKTPKMPPKYPISSTPLVPSGMTSAPQTVMRPGFKPFVDIMTPITEVSEDRTFAGLSTIHSERNLIACLSSCADSTGSTQSFLSRHKTSLGGDILADLGEHTEMLRLDTTTSMDRTEGQSDLTQDQHDSSRSSEKAPAQIMPAHTDEDLTGYEMMDIPNPCNPRDPQIVQAILESVDIPKDIGLYPCMNQAVGFLARFGQCMSLKGKKRGASSYSSEDSNVLLFDLPQVGKFKFSKKLGEGGFGAVFLVQRLNAGTLSEAELLQALEDEEGAELDANLTMDGTMTSMHTTPMALKIESPPAPWEFYILSLLRSRLPVRVNESVMRPISCHLFQDESAFLMDFLSQGTLLNCVNLAQKGGYGAGSGTVVQPGQGGLDELLAMFWAIEILRTVETVHAAGIMHGDIKVF
jgi:checkpoint serine/threonine-protein kinase